MHHRRGEKLLAHVLLAVALVAAEAAHASCDGAFCVLNTNWDMHESAAPGQARLDLRYEYIKQDQLLSGGSKISAADITGDVAELKTVNRNTILSADLHVHAELERRGLDSLDRPPALPHRGSRRRHAT